MLAESALIEAIEADKEEKKRLAIAKRSMPRQPKRPHIESDAGPSVPRKKAKNIKSELDPAPTVRKKPSRAQPLCIFCPDDSPFPTIPIYAPYNPMDPEHVVYRGHVACAR